MKSKIFRRIATGVFFTAMFTSEMFSQSVKYSGDAELGVVATENFANAGLGLSTTHGAYFAKPQLFVGAGASAVFNIDGEFYNTVYPIYGDIRKDFSINRLFTAFIDAKAGYTLDGNQTGTINDSGLDYGFYCYPSVGLRVKTSERCGIYLKVGYTYQDATLSHISHTEGELIEGSKKYNAGGFSVSLGFSF
ncbi:MAG: hypothetical protein K2N48_14845 [Muribaculaceae bacterium]|nr:hypothetical protein [Muribaculaceae bacterium]